MPRYEFICDHCDDGNGHPVTYDIFLTVKEFENFKQEPKKCPDCGKDLRYLFNAPMMKWKTTGGTGVKGFS